MSEIDDIFASKGKGKAAQTIIDHPSKADEPGASKKKTKKKKQKTKEHAPPPQDPEPTRPSSKKRPAPETIVDPSQLIPLSSKRHKSNHTAKDVKKARKEDEERFKDSRGSDSRRTTEEGWSIYKEDELGISNTGGDTPLCPFDCECCF